VLPAELVLRETCTGNHAIKASRGVTPPRLNTNPLP
jgi:hypothetical protein